MTSIPIVAPISPCRPPAPDVAALRGCASDATAIKVSSAAALTLSVARTPAEECRAASGPSFAAAGAGASRIERSIANELVYKELTRRIPPHHLSLIEAKMRELQTSPREVDVQINAIKAHLDAGTYSSLPENYYYYGLIGVQSGKLSIELFSILVDHLTLTAQGVVDKVVCPLFAKNEEGELILNKELADSVLCTLRDFQTFPTKEAGYKFLEEAFKDLPAAALQIQIYTPTSTPDSVVTLDWPYNDDSYEVGLIKFHDRPLGTILSKTRYSFFLYFKQGEVWKRMSVSSEFYQRFLDHVFYSNAVKANLVLGHSSIEDIRKNGRTSTRDEGMVYIIPSENEKGYELQGAKYVDSYPAYDLDGRDHDRYHTYVCSTLPKEAVRAPLINTSTSFTQLANLASFLIEKNPDKKREKGQKLLERDAKIAEEIEKGTPLREIMERFAIPERFLIVLEHLTNESSGQKNIKALRNLAWVCTDMEFHVPRSIYIPPSYSSKDMRDRITLQRFSSDLMEKIDLARIYDTDDKLRSVNHSTHPLAARAKEILETRLHFHRFATPEAQYNAEMLICDLGFFPDLVVTCIREAIHGNSLEPSYAEWLSFRGIVIPPVGSIVAPMDPPANSLESVNGSEAIPLTEDLLVPVAQTAVADVVESSAEVVASSVGIPLTEDLLVPVAQTAVADVVESSSEITDRSYAIPLTEDLLEPFVVPVAAGCGAGYFEDAFFSSFSTAHLEQTFVTGISEGRSAIVDKSVGIPLTEDLLVPVA